MSAAQAVGSLYAQLGLDSAQFDTGLSKARGKLSDFGKTKFADGLKAGVGEVEGALSGLASRTPVVGAALSSLGVVGVAAGAAIAVAFTGAREAMAFGDEIADTANKLRVSTDYLQELRFAAHGLGGDFKDADAALEGFTKTFGLAQSGFSSKAVKPFTALGLDPEDFNTTEEALGAVIDKIAALASAAEQAAIAEKFGLEPLLPAIREGSAAIDEMMGRARELGYVMDAELVAKAGDANDEYEALSAVLNVQFKSAMVDAIPLVMQVMGLLIDGAKAAGDFAESLADVGEKWAWLQNHAPNGQAVANDRDRLFAKMASDARVREASNLSGRLNPNQSYMAQDAVARASDLSALRGPAREATTEIKNLLREEREAAAAARTHSAALRDQKAALREREAELRKQEAAIKATSDAADRMVESLQDQVTALEMGPEQLRIAKLYEDVTAAIDSGNMVQAASALRLIERLNDLKKAKVEAYRVDDDQITTLADLTDGTLDLDTALEALAYDLADVANLFDDGRYGVERMARAIDDNDWTGAMASLVSVLANVDKAFKTGATSAEKFGAVAGAVSGIGGMIGGTGGAAISGAASGAMAGFSLGGPPGAVVGGLLGAIGGIFGSSKAKKQAKAEAEARRLAEEAQRQQTIADTAFQIEIETLRAMGKEAEATARQQEAEIAALRALSPALADAKQAYYEMVAANEKAAAAADLARQARELDIQWMEATGNTLGALAARHEDHLASLDESLRARQLEIWAAQAATEAAKAEAEAQLALAEAQAQAQKVAEDRAKAVADFEMNLQDQVDELAMSAADLKVKAYERELAAATAVSDHAAALTRDLWALKDAAAKSAAAAQEAADAFEIQQAHQKDNIALMRQLNAMDDAILGTTSARDAQKQDELAALDETGKYLQKIIWAREEEQERIKRATEAMEAQAARAAELLRERTDLENDLLRAIGSPEALAKVKARERAAILDSMDPSLRALRETAWAVDDANAAVAESQQAVAEAHDALSAAYDRESTALKDVIAKNRDRLQSLENYENGLTAETQGGRAEYSRAKTEFDRVAALIRAGDESGLDELLAVQQRFVAAAKDGNTTAVGEARDIAAVKATTRLAADLAAKQVDTATAQLAALDASVAGLVTVNSSVLSVRDAIGRLANVQDQLNRAQAAKSAADAAAQAAVLAALDKPKPVAINDNDSADIKAAKAIYLSATTGIASDIFGRLVGATASAMFATMSRVGYEGDPEALRAKYKFASGGVFTNGIVTEPTHFDIGQMGEAGKEGILPLASVGGKLGVHAVGAGNAELIAEVRALKGVVDALRAAGDRTALAGEKTARILTNVNSADPAVLSVAVA